MLWDGQLYITGLCVGGRDREEGLKHVLLDPKEGSKVISCDWVNN